MSSDSIPFELWLETEIGEPNEQHANRSHENFCNVSVTLKDGRRYALNVWTFDFLPLARFPWPYEANDDTQPADYVLPPDLFVECLDRVVIHRVITELLATDQMKTEWLVECD
jgi:hypothetical protein